MKRSSLSIRCIQLMRVSIALNHFPPYKLCHTKLLWLNEFLLVWKLFHIYDHIFPTFTPFLLLLFKIRSPKQHKLLDMRVNSVFMYWFIWFYMLCSLFLSYIPKVLFAFETPTENWGDVFIELYIIVPSLFSSCNRSR